MIFICSKDIYVFFFLNRLDLVLINRLVGFKVKFIKFVIEVLRFVVVKYGLYLSELVVRLVSDWGLYVLVCLLWRVGFCFFIERSCGVSSGYIFVFIFSYGGFWVGLCFFVFVFFMLLSRNVCCLYFGYF